MKKSIHFREKIALYVNKKLIMAGNARRCGNFKAEFRHLEDAHVLGQQSTYCHTLVHWCMFFFGLRHRSVKEEMLGQIMRLAGAVTKTAFGLLSFDNKDGSTISAFKTVPLSKENKAILDKINDA